MTGARVLRVIEFLDASAIVCLYISKLPEDSVTGWTLPRLGVWPPDEITETVYSATPTAFEQCRERLEANCCWCSDGVKATVTGLPRIGKPGPKCIVWPLVEEVRNGVEDGILVNRLLLEFDAGDSTETVLVVLEHCSGKELIEDLGLSTCERHQVFSVLNH
jgi:hypothetical protein